jgi:hypothetical protein
MDPRAPIDTLTFTTSTAASNRARYFTGSSLDET